MTRRTVSVARYAAAAFLLGWKAGSTLVANRWSDDAREAEAKLNGALDALEFAQADARDSKAALANECSVTQEFEPRALLDAIRAATGGDIGPLTQMVVDPWGFSGVETFKGTEDLS